MVKETWRVIPSQPALLASSLGRIMVAPRNGSMPHGGPRPIGGEPTLGQWDGARFLYARRRQKTLKVARLVCEAFHGAPPFERAVCMHMDENSRNNAPTNLKWGTQKENLNAPGFLEYCRSRIGDKSPTRKAAIKRAA